MAKVQWKPGTLLSPLPAALISCGTMERPNAMTAAWTGIINSDPPMVYVSIRPPRYSHELITKSKEFVINVTGDALARAADYCGVKSGRDEDKFAACGITVQKSFVVGCPSIAEAPVSLECRVFDIRPLGSHDMFMAKVVSASVNDELIDETGRLALEKADILSFIHGEYYGQGAYVGHFGWTVKKDGQPQKR